MLITAEQLERILADLPPMDSVDAPFLNMALPPVAQWRGPSTPSQPAARGIDLIATFEKSPDGWVLAELPGFKRC